MKIIDKTIFYCTDKSRNAGIIHFDLRYNCILLYKQLYSALQTFVLSYAPGWVLKYCLCYADGNDATGSRCIRASHARGERKNFKQIIAAG